MIGSLFKKSPNRTPSDLERILNIESSRTLNASALALKWSNKLTLTNASLRPIQGLALEVISVYGCLFGSIGVGWGKTLICLLAGSAAGAKRPLLLCPPALVKQMEQEAKTWSRLFRFVPPKIVSYGTLSTEKGRTLLRDYGPDLIIADEMHALRHKTSVRTKRVLRYFTHTNPTAGFVGVSGTITSNSILDYGHLLELCLRDRAPIPLSRMGVGGLQSWASCIDPAGEGTAEDYRAIWPLVRWAGHGEFIPDTAREKKTIVRDAFRKRLTSTPGVICTSESSCEASIHIVEHRPPTGQNIRRALERLARTWETPHGDPIVDASHYARTAKQLSLGFYYRWDWPGEPDLEWLNRRRAFVRAVSRVLRYSAREGLDSPSLVERWLEAGKGNTETRHAWSDWLEVKHKPAPDLVAVWIDDSIIEYALDWLARQKDPAMIWYQSIAVGEALYDLGLPVYGADTECPSSDPRYPHRIGASIAVHGKGRNLQKYHTGLVLEPCSGARFEQLIGRYHRQGQRADLVEFHILQHTKPLRDAMVKARTDALYIEQSTGQKQKLNFSRYLLDQSA